MMSKDSPPQISNLKANMKTDLVTSSAKLKNPRTIVNMALMSVDTHTMTIQKRYQNLRGKS